MDLKVMDDALQRCELFKGLGQKQVDFLRDNSNLRSFSADEIVYERGQESGGTFALIGSGRISVVAENGFVLKELGPGEIIGEVGVTTPQERRTVTITAVEPTEILEWRIDDVREEVPQLVQGLKDLAWKRMKYWS